MCHPQSRQTPQTSFAVPPFLLLLLLLLVQQINTPSTQKIKRNNKKFKLHAGKPTHGLHKALRCWSGVQVGNLLWISLILTVRTSVIWETWALLIQEVGHEGQGPARREAEGDAASWAQGYFFISLFLSSPLAEPSPPSIFLRINSKATSLGKGRDEQTFHSCFQGNGKRQSWKTEVTDVA